MDEIFYGLSASKDCFEEEEWQKWGWKFLEWHKGFFKILTSEWIDGKTQTHDVVLVDWLKESIK